MKKVSIITVTYNVSKAILPTLESVKQIKTPDIEYIIIDGGSSDDTLDIIKSYGDVVDVLVSEHDKGIYDAMNKGISLSSGEWIIFQNCGDEILLVPIKKLDSVDLQVKAVCGRTIDEKENISIPRYDISLYHGNSIPHQALFYRSNWQPHFDISYKVFADYDLNLKMFKEGVKVKLIEDIIAIHNLDGISMNKRYVKEIYRLMRNRCGLYRMFCLYFYWKWTGLLRKFGLLS